MDHALIWGNFGEHKSCTLFVWLFFSPIFFPFRHHYYFQFKLSGFSFFNSQIFLPLFSRLVSVQKVHVLRMRRNRIPSSFSSGFILRIFFVLLLFSQFEHCATQENNNVLKLGCIYPFASSVNGGAMQRIVEIAATEVNDRQLIPNYNISVIFRYCLN